MLLDPEARHDQASDAFFEETPRYPDIAHVIVQLQPQKLLDVGCGSGYLAKLLKARVPGLVVHGMDISSVALERARNYTDQVWQVDLDKTDLPVPSDQYDTVTCIEVLEHLYDPKPGLLALSFGPPPRTSASTRR
jgi:2-polyprenyl-3-methyl-5-hydroxy-6-metoxy-1,4-benzoquinol methylase